MFSFNDDIGQQIDDKRFDQQFFVNTRGLKNNHTVNPYARTNRLYDGKNNFSLVFPPESQPDGRGGYESACCNKPGGTYISGKRNEEVQNEGTSLFWTDLENATKRQPKKTTAIIGFDASENSF
jgi:hypothetical protein